MRLRDGGARSYEALLVAPAARAVSGVEGAMTWWPGGDPEIYGGLLRDMDEGYAKRIAIVVPPGAVWPLPAYELALMTAGQAVTWVTTTSGHRRDPRAPGPVALRRRGQRGGGRGAGTRGVVFKTGVVARREKDGLVLEPGGEHVEAQRVFAVPRLLGPAIEGLPADEEGFILAGDDARFEGCERTWAAGDAVVSPHQVRRPRDPSGAPRRRGHRAVGRCRGSARSRESRSSTAAS